MRNVTILANAALVSFTVETTVPPLSRPARQREIVTQGRDRQALGVPNFSREAAFLLDAMAALPRKWVSGGAPTLPWQTIALPRGGGNLAEFGVNSVSLFSNHFRGIGVHHLQVAEEHFGADHAADGDVACEQD